ncbi:SEP-domain-containing protein [Fomitiporia mediterranea MF3/22]|uniref:SEP-domain-containing protein n=1 Tax=Fomitiporia mediterranea (strain MF3/22) TaxID=694068 RepID=UPI0004407C84|nr:SEP-domain-containing protein [Fomitiporia mediterranea MF3/22]EJD08470.1 SEP-domain-containing protein [Fomitiporia mediterranea MF3/22]
MGQYIRRRHSQKPSEKATDAGLPSSASEGPASGSAFNGSVHTPDNDEVESQSVPNPNAATEQPLTEEAAMRHVTFWRNGFSFMDGPLLNYNDPANAKILHMLNQGQAPADLLNVINGQLVELHVVRRMQEDYTVPDCRGAVQN